MVLYFEKPINCINIFSEFNDDIYFIFNLKLYFFYRFLMQVQILGKLLMNVHIQILLRKLLNSQDKKFM